MSFAVDLEAQRDAQPTTDDSGETKIGLIITKASNLLTDFANGVNGLERLIQLLGSKRDSRQLRKTIEDIRIVDLNDYKTQLEHLINDISHLIANNVNASSEDKFSEEKLRKEFDSVKNNFNQLKRRYSDRKSSIILKDRLSNKAALSDESVTGSPTAGNEQTPLLQQQQQQQQQQQYTLAQQDLDLHAVLAEERASEIKKIHGGVEEINSIYKQLGFLVQQQGHQVDTVENNMTNLANNAQNATQELRKADEYQKNKRKWSCVLLIFLVVFTLIIVLATFS
ncbi:CYFA0S13e02982g1_1 [Cyberlindnera fabianii]|uniref:CYFA0S13e02982g1_1 n=1 Tax=Cyberlindnera fabianii TaxID=36022 RepID=A0A061B2E8_CYBFA|nr:CYFA0S13e02982g1_1 [Cyberlindnera fabianii]